ncbi:hypothetical protein I0C86_14985 [Plantactinospora sp. S1510]|uniref:Uncharacterized protein n=1 Tax=Plantactinospora alkalitolerans TaxID=2789879 RepID=A0ABS0GVM7_9ACTN|nr:hypothetical protein [Plantactinospora alkalitolerans]MBF9130250.1 hypothetical protein [Plantactinospora alkalitolerans]
MRHATVFADYGQFYLQDSQAHNAAMRAGAATDPTRAAGGWTDEAVRLHRIGLEPHSISVGAARSDFVETALSVHETAPAIVPEAEHVVEADLDVVTGAVLLVGCTAPRDLTQALNVEPGRYRVRVSYVPADPLPNADPDVDGDHFTHLIEMWPISRAERLTVIRQGPYPWAN